MSSTRTILYRASSYSLKQVSRNLFFEVYGRSSGTPCRISTTGNLLKAGSWSQVGAWYDGLQVTITVNGRVEATAPCIKGPIRYSNPAGVFSIGGITNGSRVSQPYAGSIDEVQVESKAPFTTYGRHILNVTTRRNCSRRGLPLTRSHNLEAFVVTKRSPTSTLLIQGTLSGRGNHAGDIQFAWRYGSGREVTAQSTMYDNNVHSKVFPTTAIISNHTRVGPQTLVFRYFTGNRTTGNRPFNIYNPDKRDDPRLSITCSVYIVWELQ